ncbi:MAG: hypothetical protein MI919_02005 [Holophagales bacterium]|nr:hypothetical protein [Holophagales bacterium]
MEGFGQKVLGWLGHHAWAGIGSIVGILALVISLAQWQSGPGSPPPAQGAAPPPTSSSAPEAGYVQCGPSSAAQLQPASGRRPGRYLKGDYVNVIGSVRVFAAAREKADLLGVWKKGTRLKTQSSHGNDWCYFVRMGG